jgi:tetratricopeptide (TPR) repeat protein
MMSKAAAGQLIALDSDLYQQGVAQFEQNIGLLLSTYQQAQIPAFIGTLFSNEVDQPPFQSEPALSFVPEPGSENAEQELLRLLKQYPQHAHLHFNYGRLLRQQGQMGAAFIEFQLARDLDLLRFRAPSAFNPLIRRLAVQHNAVLVDTESKLRGYSKDQLLGQQLLLEHVHPNAQGYALMAQAYLEQLIQSGVLPRPAPDIRWRQQNAKADLPLTRVDVLLAEYKIRQLKAFYPFVQYNNQHNRIPDFGPQPDKEHQLAYQRSQGLSWLDASQQLLEYYQKQQQVAEAAKVAGLLFDSLPNQHQAAYVAGQLYFAAEDLALAIYYQRLALALGTDPLNDRMALARSYFFAGKLSEAIELLQQVLKLDPQHKAAQQQLQRLTPLQHQQRSK